MPDSQWAGGLSGWKLTLAAGIAFLAPLLLAILGATLAGEGANRRFLGAGVGLALGVTMAILITKYLARRWDQPSGEPRSDKEQE